MASRFSLRSLEQEFVSGGEFVSTVIERFPAPRPITTEMISEAIAFEEQWDHEECSDKGMDYSSYVPTAPEEAMSLKLSFRRIPELCGLDALEKLQVLHLDNNDIKTIENISHLTRLRSLDLSFNAIATIQGLEALVELQDLTLYGNQITAIEGLDTLKQLEFLSLGRNRVASLASVKQLRALPRLRALSLEANPVAAAEDQYRPYVITFVPQLRFLDFALITDEERDDAKQGGVSLEELQAAEQEDRERAETAATAAATTAKVDEYARMHMSAAVTALDDSLHAAPQLADLQHLRDMIGPVTLVTETFTELAAAFKSAGAHRHRQIEDELASFEAAKGAVLAEAEAKAADAVMQLRKHIKRIGAAFRSESPPDPEESERLRQHARDLESQLTTVELLTTEKMRSMINTLESALNELKLLKLGEHDRFFRGMETAVKLFQDQAAGVVQQAHESFSATGALPPEIDETSDVGMALQSKDSTENMLKEAFDSMDGKLISLDEMSRKGVTDMCAGAVTKANREELERNRMRLNEIICLRTAVETQLDEWKSRALHVASSPPFGASGVVASKGRRFSASFGSTD